MRVRERESEAEERGVLWERRRRYFTGKRALVGERERERERERETEGERLGTVPPVGADGGEFNVILVLSASHLYIVVDSEAERERERDGGGGRESSGEGEYTVLGRHPLATIGNALKNEVAIERGVVLWCDVGIGGQFVDLAVAAATPDADKGPSLSPSPSVLVALSVRSENECISDGNCENGGAISTSTSISNVQSICPSFRPPR